MATLGTRLKESLAALNMSQKDLASTTGCTEAAISQYVNDVRIPRATVLGKIASALGVTSEYLISGTEESTRDEIDYTMRLIARNANSLSHEEKLNIINMLI